MEDPKQAFEESYHRVIGGGTGISPQAEAFFHLFYEKFTATSPLVARMFRDTDMEQQEGMLRKSFFHLISLFVTGNPDAQLIRIAESHSKKGYRVEPELYDFWLSALLDAVRDTDKEYSPEVELGWVLAFTPGVLVMKHVFEHS